MKKLFLLFWINVIANVLFAQEKANNYVLKSIDGYVHLYYDDQYYLVDHNCEFRTYTRVIKYDQSIGGFNGFFTDYYNNNIPALTGTYTEGKRDGEFKGYYPSGQLRSVKFYQNDVPTGNWKYFYSNGSPWITVEFKNQIPYVQEFWNVKGKQRIKEGNGTHNLIIETTDYSEYGYTGMAFKGNIKNGRPNGLWTAFLDYGGNTQELIGTEFFIKNNFITSNYTFPEGIKPNQSFIIILPTAVDERSASLISKSCTIDDNKGFTQYLQNHLNSSLPKFWMLETLPIDDFFDVMIRVNKKGESSKIIIPNTLPQKFVEALENSLKTIPYWIPSFINNKTIDDTFIITITKFFNEKGEPSFGYPTINRKNGK